jgi:hypothetical protein
MTWLVEQARELGGRFLGSLAVGRSYARFDGVQVPAGAAHDLAERVAGAWPGTADAPDALAAAVAQAWASWAATSPLWVGAGQDLLAKPLPSGAVVVGLWWD